MASKAPVSAGPDRGKKLTLTFGLVSIPLRYKPLSEGSSGGVSAKMMCPEHELTLNQGPYVCGRGTEGEHTIERADIVKGYPHPDEAKQLVIVDPSVLEEFAEERTGDAEIDRIVDVGSIDPAYFDKVYVVWPGDGKNAERSFDLLATVLRESGKAAVTTAVLSKQTRTIVFRWSEEFDCLIAHVCRFRSEIRLADVQVVGAVAAQREEPSEAELDLARQIFATLEGEFDPADVDDEWTPAVQNAIRQAAGGKTAPKKAETKKVVEPAGDLMATLNASLKAATAKTKTPTKPRAKKKVTA